MSEKIVSSLTDAAVRKAIEDIELPSQEWINRNCTEWDNKVTFAEAIIKYLRDLKAGKFEL